MINLDGKDFQAGGKSVALEPNTYPMKLKEARAYRDWDFDKTKIQAKLDLIWDSGLVVENDDGEEVDAYVYDSFIVISLNEKANLVKRLSAILGPNFDPAKCKVALEFEGVSALDELPMREEGKTKITRFDVDGESIFGREALVELSLNKNGYNKVTNVSRPLATAGKAKARPAGAPA